MKYRMELGQHGKDGRVFEVTDDGETEISGRLFGLDINSRCDDATILTLHLAATDRGEETERTVGAEVAASVDAVPRLVHTSCGDCAGHEIDRPIGEEK